MNKRKLKLDKYGISGKRFKELSGFCEQYPDWKEQLLSTRDALKSPSFDGIGSFSGNTSDTTGALAVKRLPILQNCELIERTAREAGGDLAGYIIKSVCYEVPLKYLITVEQMPCSRSAFYDMRRYFFYLLDKNK